MSWLMLKQSLAFTIALALTTTPALAGKSCNTFAGVMSPPLQTTCFSAARPTCFGGAVTTKQRHYVFGLPVEFCYRNGRPIFCGDL